LPSRLYFRSAGRPPAGSRPSARRFRSASSAPAHAPDRARRWCNTPAGRETRQPGVQKCPALWRFATPPS
jgi:hypothetical protein